MEDSANKLSYDLFYLKNFSFLLDLLILFKTIRLVFNAQGSLPVPNFSNSFLEALLAQVGIINAYLCCCSIFS